MVKLLRSFGLEGFPLFMAATGVSILILFIAFLMAARRPKEGSKK